MAALVQPFPAQTSTVGMLQTRPASATGNFQHVSQAHVHNLHNNRPPSMARNLYANPSGTVGSYRGQPTHASVAPYAFTSTPGGTFGQQPQPLASPARQENRISTAPVNSYQPQANGNGRGHQRYPTATSNSTSSSSSSSDHPAAGSEDSSMASTPRPGTVPSRPASGLSINTIVPAIPNINLGSKPSPDRYRRANRKSVGFDKTNVASHQVAAGSGSASPSGSGMPAVDQLYGVGTTKTNNAAPAPAPASHSFITFGNAPHIPSPRQPNGSPSTVFTSQPVPTGSVDDLSLNRPASSEQAKRYHRRSVSGLGSNDSMGGDKNVTGIASTPQSRLVAGRQEHAEWRSPATPRPTASSHSRNGSADSTASTHSRPSVSHAPPLFHRICPTPGHTANLDNTCHRPSTNAWGVFFRANTRTPLPRLPHSIRIRSPDHRHLQATSPSPPASRLIRTGELPTPPPSPDPPRLVTSRPPRARWATLHERWPPRLLPPPRRRGVRPPSSSRPSTTSRTRKAASLVCDVPSPSAARPSCARPRRRTA